MKKNSKEKLLQLKISYPSQEDGIIKYIDTPTDYILIKRLNLNPEEVDTIREAYLYYQSTVRDVLENRLHKIQYQNNLRTNTSI